MYHHNYYSTNITTTTNTNTNTSTYLRMLVAVVSLQVGLEYRRRREQDDLSALEARVAVPRKKHEGVIDLRFDIHAESRNVGINRVGPGL